MISNERQYHVTRNAAQRFEQALDQLEQSDRPEPIRRIMRDGMESQLQELREEMAEYDALRGGQVSVLELDSLRALPEALIRARIAVGLTQRQLAERLGMKEQQLQRYEATRYSGVSLDRIQEVADALGVQIREQVILAPPNGINSRT